jgi:hypothetical protein
MRNKNILALCFIPFLCTSCVITNKIKARHLAEDYLQQRYAIKAKCYRVRMSWEPWYYKVYFRSIDDPELFFTVTILSDLSSPQEFVTRRGNIVPDDYLPQVFCLDTERFLSPKIQEIWDGKTQVALFTDISPVIEIMGSQIARKLRNVSF